MQRALSTSPEKSTSSQATQDDDKAMTAAKAFLALTDIKKDSQALAQELDKLTVAMLQNAQNAANEKIDSSSKEQSTSSKPAMAPANKGKKSAKRAMKGKAPTTAPPKPPAKAPAAESSKAKAPTKASGKAPAKPPAEGTRKSSRPQSGADSKKQKVTDVMEVSIYRYRRCTHGIDFER